MKNKSTQTRTPGKLISLAFFAALMVSFHACEKYVITAPDEIGEVTFSGTIQPVFTAKCNNCHNGDIHPLNLSEGSAYNEIQSYTPESGGQMINSDSPEESVLYIMALDGAHGYFSLSATEKAQILKWITEGALDN
ncbi:MAG: hypothetical protein WD052_04715 [Bacteroidales bacterium]